jgi:hypothetical protein
MKTLTHPDQPAYPIDCGDLVFTGLTKREEFVKDILCANIVRNGILSPDLITQSITTADNLIKALNETAEDRPVPNWFIGQKEEYLEGVKKAAGRAHSEYNTELKGGYDIFGRPQ